MQKPALCRALPKNLAVLQDRFGGSDDFYTKKLSVGGIACAIVLFTGISSPEKLCRLALDMLDRDPAFFGGGPGLCEYLLHQSLIPAEPQPASDLGDRRAARQRHVAAAHRRMRAGSRIFHAGDAAAQHHHTER